MSIAKSNRVGARIYRASPHLGHLATYMDSHERSNLIDALGSRNGIGAVDSFFKEEVGGYVRVIQGLAAGAGSHLSHDVEV